MSAEARRVVVGVDGSPHSAAALSCAATEASLRGSELVVVTVCGREVPPAVSGGRPVPAAAAEPACRDMQARLLSQLPAGAVPRVTARVVRGDPAGALNRLVTVRDVLMLGTRGRSRMRSLLLGSVALGCVGQAPCPVMVVPTAGHAAARQGAASGPVVAGVDLSVAARKAFHFAAEEAALRSVPLIAVHAVYSDYVRQNAIPAGDGGEMGLLPPLDSAWAQLDTFIRSELGAAAETTARPVVACGDPERVLLQWTKSAALVVVGRRAAGRLHNALLGSVSTYLLQHAQCPVAVVPAPVAAS